jgi:hypothetical protein
MTTHFPVYATRQAFCSKKCADEFHSWKRAGLMLVFLVGHALVFCAPWAAFFYVPELLGVTGFLSLPLRFGAAIAAGAVVSLPVYRLLDRLGLV